MEPIVNAIMPILIFLTDLVTYLANGFLASIYFLLESLPQLVAIAMAVLIALTFDRIIQLQAVYAPQRYKEGAVTPTKMPRTAQAITLVAITLWLLATYSFRAVVPVIGAVMWSASFLALLIMPQQRWPLLWSTKAYLIVYSLVVIALRVYLWYSSRISPAALAEVFNGTASSSSILAQSQGNLSIWMALILWGALPAGFLWLLIQNWMVQPMSIVGPFQGVEDVLITLRTRGNQDVVRSMGERPSF